MILSLMFALWALLVILRSKEPLAPCVLLVIGASLSASALWFKGSPWMGLSLALMFAGGMMVMFTYISSLVVNSNKFTTGFSLKKFYMLTSLLLTAVVLEHSPLWVFPASLLGSTSALWTASLAVLLLLALLMVVKIAQSFKGSLNCKF